MYTTKYTFLGINLLIICYIVDIYQSKFLLDLTCSTSKLTKRSIINKLNYEYYFKNYIPVP